MYLSFLSYRFYVTLSMLAWVERLLPYSDQVASHSNHILIAALPFSSNNSFSRSRDGRVMVIAIHGDDWCKSFTWPDALPDAKPSYGTGPLSACVQIRGVVVCFWWHDHRMQFNTAKILLEHFRGQSWESYKKKGRGYKKKTTIVWNEKRSLH